MDTVPEGIPSGKDSTHSYIQGCSRGGGGGGSLGSEEPQQRKKGPRKGCMISSTECTKKVHYSI